MFSQESVCPQRGCQLLIPEECRPHNPPDRHTPGQTPPVDRHKPPGQTPPPGRQSHPLLSVCLAYTPAPPPPQILRDMANKRTVRIPLECILVLDKNQANTNIITVHKEVAKVMFLHVSVILFTGGSGIPACIAGGIPACLAAGSACSGGRGGGLLLGGACFGGCLLPKADGYCCGRYASYWNAFLL